MYPKKSPMLRKLFHPSSSWDNSFAFVFERHLVIWRLYWPVSWNAYEEYLCLQMWRGRLNGALVSDQMCTTPQGPKPGGLWARNLGEYSPRCSQCAGMKISKSFQSCFVCTWSIKKHLLQLRISINEVPSCERLPPCDSPFMPAESENWWPASTGHVSWALTWESEKRKVRSSGMRTITTLIIIVYML